MLFRNVLATIKLHRLFQRLASPCGVPLSELYEEGTNRAHPTPLSIPAFTFSLIVPAGKIALRMKKCPANHPPSKHPVLLPSSMHNNN